MWKSFDIYISAICFSDTSDMEEDGGEDSKSVKTNDENKKWVQFSTLKSPWTFGTKTFYNETNITKRIKRIFWKLST